MAYSDLLIWQYQGKPKALATIQLLENVIAQGFIDLYQLQDVLNIETATGDQLDLVGKHVGQTRVINGYQLRKFFGFQNAQNAMGFSRTRQGGGRWYRKRDPLADSVRLSDADYRFLIKCRIVKNYQIGTLPNIIEACHFILGVDCRVVDNLNMTVTVTVNNGLSTDFVKYAINHLDILPRQAGTKIIFQLQ
ncbi:hypothetical protein BKK47_02570 [Rodentibacter mrazii]|uniref:DUF2612 domain-containing protein n=1 Tax=Rodentibacter mrazii TaxID=1908257 RepID=A0A1V3II65_9PAST|nr:DUF2612 domain-containing protein [Rodentibacter mrazii]OOF40932.1 hypothetical protein BKK47_02570 [Rodentibacter mrazii]